MKRPGTGTYTTTPAADALRQLLGGGVSCKSISLTDDEFRAVQRLYGFTPEPTHEKPPPPEPPPADAYSWERRNYESDLRAHSKWVDPVVMMQAGADRNALRHAQSDGLRMLAWLARYVDPGEDPVKALIRIASVAGLDVAPEDYEWATTDPDESDDRCTPEHGQAPQPSAHQPPDDTGS